MNLKAAVVAARQRPGGTCGFVAIYEQLPKADATELRRLFAARNYTTAQIHRGLAIAGYPLSRGTVERHRKLECKCGAL